MAVKPELNLTRLPLLDLGRATASIARALAAGQAARLGQSAVLSTKVHAFALHKPEHVQILINTDAGQVFYHRKDCGAVCHLDVFHECGEIDHGLTAGYICQAVTFYNAYASRQRGGPYPGLVNSALIDLQTATGGGRITGSLLGGQKFSVRRVHENHVHVTLRTPANDFACLFYIVAAVEAAIQAMSLELRCNESISYAEAADGQLDLSPYTDQTDSFLNGRPAAPQPEYMEAAVADQGPDLQEEPDWQTKDFMYWA